MPVHTPICTYLYAHAHMCMCMCACVYLCVCVSADWRVSLYIPVVTEGGIEWLFRKTEIDKIIWLWISNFYLYTVTSQQRDCQAFSSLCPQSDSW